MTKNMKMCFYNKKFFDIFKKFLKQYLNGLKIYFLFKKMFLAIK